MSIEVIRRKFRSGNAVNVERAVVLSEEWCAVEALVAKVPHRFDLIHDVDVHSPSRCAELGGACLFAEEVK